MFDLDGVVGFEWDSGNARKNERHGVSQSEAEQVYFDSRLLVAPDLAHSAIETRHHALGATLAGRHLHLTFTLRAGGTLIRAISARDIHRRERQIYGRKN